MVPSPLVARPCENSRWSVDGFRWSAPEGDMTNVPAFLEFHRARLNELIEKRFASVPVHGS